MMKKLLVISVLAMAIIGTPIAQAGHKGHKAKRAAFYDEAEVVSVEPITRTVRISVPERECWEEEVHYSDAPIHAADAARNVFIGGIVGGIIGHQFGSGRGKDAATLAGTLIGASVAHDRAKRRAPAHSHERVATEERCRVVNQYQTEERIDGYWVTYRYQGESYTTRMPFDPGSSIRVRVQVSPVRNSVTF
jgi:uncharacterized protein YcfJ